MNFSAVKPILFLLILLGPLQLSATTKALTLLQCLGQEEERLHKSKTTGAIYQLNQQLIAAITTANQLNFRPKYRRLVCNNPILSPSVALLEQLLLKRDQVFSFKGQDHRQNSSFAISQLLSNLPSIFFSYLSNLQRYAQHPLCLKAYLPHLDYFMERFLYLEGHFSGIQLLDERRKIKELFAALPQLDNIYQSCQLNQKSK